MKKIRLYTPGPCTVPEDALLEMARPFEHHRTPWFKELHRECEAKLQQVMQTKNQVLILTGSGTATAESAIVGCNPKGSKMLIIEGGKFGQRWGKICKQYGIDYVPHVIDWGTAVDPQVVAEYIKKDPAITSVMVVHSETSTGTACDLEGIAKITSKAGKLLLADCITSVGALPVKTDEWGVDVVITGSQKALMLPPGLGMLSISERAWQVIGANKDMPQFYLDLNRMRKSAENYDTPFTPAHLLYRGLRVTLDMLLEEGMENVWKRVATMAAATRAAAEAIGMPNFSKSPADSVTAICSPQGIDADDIRKDLKNRFGVHVAGGQDHLKGKIIRISQMGFIDTIDSLAVIAAVEQSLYKLGHKFELGAGLAAAQKVVAERA